MVGGLMSQFTYTVCIGLGRIGVFIMLYFFCLVGMGIGVVNLSSVLAGIGLPLAHVTVPAIPVTFPISVISWFFFAILLRINYEELRVIAYAFQVAHKWVLGAPRLMINGGFNSRDTNEFVEKCRSLYKFKKKYDYDNSIDDAIKTEQNEDLKNLLNDILDFKNNWKMFSEKKGINNDKNFTTLNSKIDKDLVCENDIDLFIKQELNNLLIKCLDYEVFMWKMRNPIISGEIKTFTNTYVRKLYGYPNYNHTNFLDKINDILSLLPLGDSYVLLRVKYILSFKALCITTWGQDIGSKAVVAYIVSSSRAVHRLRPVAFSPKSFQLGLLAIAAYHGHSELVEKLIHTQSFLSFDEIQYFKNTLHGDKGCHFLVHKLLLSNSINKYTLLSSILVFTIANVNPFRMTENIVFTPIFIGLKYKDDILIKRNKPNPLSELIEPLIRFL
jgi:hypothetical protein